MQVYVVLISIYTDEFLFPRVNGSKSLGGSREGPTFGRGTPELSIKQGEVKAEGLSLSQRRNSDAIDVATEIARRDEAPPPLGGRGRGAPRVRRGFPQSRSEENIWNTVAFGFSGFVSICI